MAEDKELGYERLGAPKLSLVDVVAQSVGFMGPVFSAAFLIPLIVGINFAGKGAGAAAPLSVLIGVVGVFALGWIIAQYAKRIHAAGSMYDYVSNGLGSTIGAASGWLYYGGTMMLDAGLGLLIGGFIHDNIFTADPAAPGVFSSSSPLPAWGWSVLIAALLFGVLFFGVRISTKVQLALALVSMAVVLIFFISVIAQVGSDNSLKAFNPSSSPNGMSGVLFGVLFAVLLFVGFETAANLAEETAEPKRNIPRAILISVVAAGIFYVIAAYAQVAGFGFDVGKIAENAAAPLFTLGLPKDAGGYGSTAILKVLLIVVLLDMLAVYIGAAVASSRGVFSMARDRRLPSVFARVSERYGTPSGAIIFVILVNLAFVALDQLADNVFALPPYPHYYALFSWASTFGSFALSMVYLLLAVGALVGLRDHPKYVWVVIAAIVSGATMIGAMVFAIYHVPSPIVLAPYYAIAWGLIGLVVMFFVKGRPPAAETLADLRGGAVVGG